MVCNVDMWNGSHFVTKILVGHKRCAFNATCNDEKTDTKTTTTQHTKNSCLSTWKTERKRIAMRNIRIPVNLFTVFFLLLFRCWFYLNVANKFIWLKHANEHSVKIKKKIKREFVAMQLLLLVVWQHGVHLADFCVDEILYKLQSLWVYNYTRDGNKWRGDKKGMNKNLHLRHTITLTQQQTHTHIHLCTTNVRCSKALNVPIYFDK